LTSNSCFNVFKRAQIADGLEDVQNVNHLN